MRLLLAALIVAVASPACAQRVGRPDVWALCRQDDRVTACDSGVLPEGPRHHVPCDVNELLFASRAWAQVNRMPTFLPPTHPGPAPGTVEFHRREAERLSRHDRIEARWRKALEACR
jgi:hypothetical protein